MARFKKMLVSEDGQSTTEYALVILAVVALAAVLGTVGVKGMSEFVTKVFARLMESVG